MNSVSNTLGLEIELKLQSNWKNKIRKLKELSMNKNEEVTKGEQSACT